VLLTARDNPTYMARAHPLGAADCLLKNVTRKELVTAMENAAAGKPAAGTGPFARIAASMEPRSTPAVTRDSRLTPRESQALSHVALGLSNNEIARSLKISVETVKEHVRNLLRKLAVRDRTQAAVWAVQSGVV
jgi:DNA-binding NarL/FixJ family response regulator